jgi:hypothetical protein
MEKNIISYNKNDKLIQLQAISLTSENHKNIRKELKKFNVVYINIDSDYIGAEINNADYNIIEKLELLGWSF